MEENKLPAKAGLDLLWLFKMAWRDGRRNWSRMLLFISSIILGVAALVAIFSMGENASRDIDSQAKSLVGADLSVEANRALSDKDQVMLDSLGIDRSKERSFASMVYFEKSQGSRLVQIRALEGDYPYYGSLETTPASAGKSFRSKREALVDETLMVQFGAKPGDSIKVGSLHFAIAGSLNKAPGRNGFSTTIAPPVYIPLKYLEETGLMQRGSRTSYNYYYLFPASENMDTLIGTLGPRLEKAGFEYETVSSRKKRTGRVFDDFNKFLTLISFIALLMGCIGVAGSIHIYVRQKIHSIAILRCLGTSGLQAFLIYLIQVAFIGLAGSLAGAVLGTGIQQIMPSVLSDFVPVTLSSSLSWPAISKGIGMGMLLSMAFALIPLLTIRRISSLDALRFPIVGPASERDPLKWLLYVGIFLLISWFARQQMAGWKEAFAFTISIVIAFLILALFAWCLRWMVRRFFPFSWNYIWRQGFANLYRPNNQTLLLLTTVGLGTAFIGTLYFVHSMLINKLTLTSGKSQPNMILFDVQKKQKDSISELAKRNKLLVIDEIPVVTMRIDQVNGKSPDDIKQDSGRRGPARMFENEIRASFRENLTPAEIVDSGKWTGHVNSGEIIPISLETGYARWAHLKIGDKISFNVQGMKINTVVGSLRQADWKKMETNFRILFPTGVLEDAPLFYVFGLRVPSVDMSAKFQKMIVHNYPNVSVIDLGLALKVLEDLLDKIGFVIRFMAGFSILTGFIVLLSSVIISKYQRMQEMVLLRTLGASRRQILAISAVEYFFLGSLAALTGILLALAGTWALAKFSFDDHFVVPFWPVLIMVVLVSALTIIIGLVNSFDVINKPPLEVLRKDA